MSADDAGTGKRKLTPVEAFAAITFDRVLIIHSTSGCAYVQKLGGDKYHWYTVNRHGAFCGQWYWDQIKSEEVVKKKLRSEHCERTEHEQRNNLKSRIQQGLKSGSKNQEQ